MKFRGPQAHIGSYDRHPPPSRVGHRDLSVLRVERHQARHRQLASALQGALPDESAGAGTEEAVGGEGKDFEAGGVHEA
jgi:hypothetical protein